jgi:hypothetical protein
MVMFRSIKRMLWGMVPPDNPLLYKICKRYVDQYNGDNDSDFRSNGELRFMRSVLPDCTVVFDVGANIGDWAAMAASINPSATLHCFEPSKPTFQRLQERVPANVTCNNLGLSSRGGDFIRLFRGGRIEFIASAEGSRRCSAREGREGHSGYN